MPRCGFRSEAGSTAMSGSDLGSDCASEPGLDSLKEPNGSACTAKAACYLISRRILFSFLHFNHKMLSISTSASILTSIDVASSSPSDVPSRVFALRSLSLCTTGRHQCQHEQYSCIWVNNLNSRHRILWTQPPQEATCH